MRMRHLLRFDPAHIVFSDVKTLLGLTLENFPVLLVLNVLLP